MWMEEEGEDHSKLVEVEEKGEDQKLEVEEYH